jgi:hypothetical protein
VTQDRKWHAKGPYVVWRDYGCEGWSPRSYDTAAEALDAKESGDVITRVVEFKEVEVERAAGIEPA